MANGTPNYWLDEAPTVDERAGMFVVTPTSGTSEFPFVMTPTKLATFLARGRQALDAFHSRQADVIRFPGGHAKKAAPRRKGKEVRDGV